MFQLGLTLLAAAVVALAATFVPLVGILAMLLFSDLVLAGLALVVAGSLPFGGRARIAAAVVLWAMGSLAIEAVRLPVHFAQGGGVYAPEIVRHRPVFIRRDFALPVVGDPGAFVVGGGPPGFVVPQADVIGRGNGGWTSLANWAWPVEPVDMLWRRGYTPHVGSTSFPRLRMERKAADGWLHLQLHAEDAPGQAGVSFRRSYPLPPPHPGLPAETTPRTLVLGVLHHNLLRLVLGLTDAVRPDRDLKQFFDLVLERGQEGPGPRAGGPLRAVELIADRTVPLPPGTRAVSAHLEKLRPDVRIDREALRTEACGMKIQGREFGAPGTQTYVAVLDGGGDSRTAPVLNHITPGHAAFDYYCDAASGLLYTFMALDPGPALRVTGYTRDGRLADVHYLALPFRLHRTAVVQRGSLQRDATGAVRLQVTQPVVEQKKPREIVSQTQAQTLEFAFAPLR